VVANTVNSNEADLVENVVVVGVALVEDEFEKDGE